MKVTYIDGLVTLFFDGSKELFNDKLNSGWENCASLLRSYEDKEKWESWDLSDECKK